MLRPYTDQIGPEDQCDFDASDVEPMPEDVRELNEDESAEALSDALGRVAARIDEVKENDDANR